MKREQPLGATDGAACRTPDELIESNLERERSCLDFLAHRVPGREPVLTCDHRLRVVQRETVGGDLGDWFARERWQDREAAERRGILRFGRVQQRLCLLFQLFEIRTIGELARRHTNLHARARGSQTGSTAVCMYRRTRSDDSGLGPSREPAGAFYALTNKLGADAALCQCPGQTSSCESADGDALDETRVDR